VSWRCLATLSQLPQCPLGTEGCAASLTVVAVRDVPWWGGISSVAAPVLLIGGWTVAAGLQPRSFNPVADTISALAAQDAADRWVMTFALLGLGACYVVTALALRPAAALGRLILALGGVATILVAANPEPAGSGSLPHTVSAATAFIAVAIWPAVSIRRGPSVPWGLRPAACVSATVIMLGLLVWFYVELGLGGGDLGLAERILAGAEAIWPLAVALTCRGILDHRGALLD
jgi:hypothetical membrane protein